MSMSINGYGSAMQVNAYRCQQPPPDPTTMVEQAFTNLDVAGKGYLDQTDLETAVSSSGGDANALMTALDSDGDGKVTEAEMQATLQQMFSTRDRGQFDMRMAGAMPPPPPPPEDTDEGFTVDQLSQMAADLEETDSQRASEFASLVESFDSADADGNGKLSRDEAMTFLFGDNDTTTTSTTMSVETEEQNLTRQLMALVKSYGSVESTLDQSNSILSISA